MTCKVLVILLAAAQIACFVGILWTVRVIRLPFGWDRRLRRKFGISREDIYEGRDGYGRG